MKPSTPGDSVAKNLPTDAGDAGMLVQSLGWEHPLEEEMATCSSILAEKAHGQKRLLGYSPWSHKGFDTTKHNHL